MAKSHPDIQHLSVRQAASYLQTKPPRLEVFLCALEADSRHGIRALARKTRRIRKSDRAERARLRRMLKHERLLWKKGVVHVAGVDEVGRGPLAGPVVAAAVILPEGTVLPGLDDSKAMKPENRDYLFDLIHEEAVAIGLGSVPAYEIDTINIYQATFKAMRQAIKSLPVKPEQILVDGNRVPESGIPELAIVGGDAASQSIAAASVVAKVTRDREMSQVAKTYPAYGFANHKGYASSEHLKALETNGPCPIHRRSFAPVEKGLAAWSRSFRSSERPSNP